MRLFLLLLVLPACNPTPEKTDDSTTVVSDSDKDGFSGDEDCNDADATINPDAIELCDGLDNNCNDTADEGVESPFWEDGDKDGFGDPAVETEACTAPDEFVSNDQDCAPEDDAIYPGAPEVCDGIDNNCSGTADEGLGTPVYVDADGDGYGSSLEYACSLEEGYSTVGGDCDDGALAIFPGAPEFCDGLDNDCDGSIDEEGSDGAIWYYDADGDGYGNCAVLQIACVAPAGYVAAGSAESCDCNDGTAAAHPFAVELCDGVLDEDCDGQIDESDAVDAGIWYADRDGDGYGDPTATASACDAPVGYVVDTTDCADQDAAIHPGAAERCDGLDQDCDGVLDEDLSFVSWYTDADGDGHGDPSSAQVSCSQPAGTIADGSDCNDADVSVSPTATEVCDGADQDCDGVADNGLAFVRWYTDSDGDGYGDPASIQTSCTRPTNTIADGSDCNDADASISPAGVEICDGNDQNCDGFADNGLTTYIVYTDSDGDGYGAGSGRVWCEVLPGSSTANGDCDDGNGAISPVATEICNSLDDDCDSLLDESDPDIVGASVYYADQDGDSYGDASTSLLACAQPAGYGTDSADCNDADAAISPDGTELCNGYDDDCDALIDDADPSIDGQTLYYLDADGDGQGDPGTSSYACGASGSYSSTDPRDCDDSFASIYTGAPEQCNLIDDDCDGTADNGVLGTSAVCPAEDCAEIKDVSPSATDGSYYLTIGSYYCDMTRDGGGWTRVRDNAYVYGTGYDNTAYNTEAFSWNEALFVYDSGSVSAHCVYPGAMTGCNNLGFRFGADNWGVAQNWGSSICGMATSDYTGATRYIGGYDFVISRSLSTQTIRLGTLEGISNCTTSDNFGGAYVDVYVRQ